MTSTAKHDGISNLREIVTLGFNRDSGSPGFPTLFPPKTQTQTRNLPFMPPSLACLSHLVHLLQPFGISMGLVIPNLPLFLFSTQCGARLEMCTLVACLLWNVSCRRVSLCTVHDHIPTPGILGTHWLNDGLDQNASLPDEAATGSRPYVVGCASRPPAVVTGSIQTRIVQGHPDTNSLSFSCHGSSPIHILHKGAALCPCLKPFSDL